MSAFTPTRTWAVAAPAPEWWQSRRCVATAALFASLPLLWPAVPPLVDLPGHIGRYHVMLGQDHALLDR